MLVTVTASVAGDETGQAKLLLRRLMSLLGPSESLFVVPNETDRGAIILTLTTTVIYWHSLTGHRQQLLWKFTSVHFAATKAVTQTRG